MQFVNTELIDNLRAWFVDRNEPTVAWRSAAALLAALPGVRGAWTMGDFDESGNQHDLSGQGRTLWYAGNPQYGYTGLAPYLALDGTGDYLWRADEAGLDISGTESYVAAARRGLTVLAWVYQNAIGTAQAYVSKWGGAGSYSYLLYKDASDYARFYISSDGAASVIATSTVTLDATTWYFLAGRLRPSAAVDVFVNDALVSNVAGPPASCYNSGANLTLGRLSTGGSSLAGRLSMVALCACALSDTIINQVYHWTRRMYGV